MYKRKSDSRAETKDGKVDLAKKDQKKTWIKIKLKYWWWTAAQNSMLLF